jgi:hypothetical protein
MARSGGAAIIPSGAWHLELPTTVVDRSVDAPLVLPLDTEVPAGAARSGSGSP